MQEASVSSTAKELTRGLWKAPIGFLWGLVALYPAIFAIAYDRHREDGKALATMFGLMFMVAATPLIIVLTIPFALSIASAAADDQDDAFGFIAIREAVRGPAKDAA